MSPDASLSPDTGRLPVRSRGVLALLEENCTVCMICAQECPDWCIHIRGHVETAAAPQPGGRARSRNVLDSFAIDFAVCMYCGICVEACPFDALFWAPAYAFAAGRRAELVHERPALRAALAGVGAPVPVAGVSAGS